MTTKRRYFTADQKVAILKQYLVEKVSLADLCDQFGIQPNQVYQWQATLFAHAAAAFQSAGWRPPSQEAQQKQKIARLEAKLEQKNEVIAELMEENLQAKKATGEL